MAWLRRGFSLYESLERVPLDTMKGEIARLGLAVSHSRIQVAKQYALLEQRTAEAQKAPGLPPHLAVFSSTLLKQELRSRSPHLSFTGTQSTAELLTLLGSAHPGQVSGLPALLTQLSAAKTQPTTETLLQVLPQLTDLAWLPQNDWNILRESNPDSLIPLWQGLFQALNTLNKDQFISLLRAACINVTSIGMHFTPGSLQLAPEVVNTVLDRAVVLKQEMKYQDMGHVVQFAELFSELAGNCAQVKQIRQETLEKLQREQIDSLSHWTMSEIYFLLPDGAYTTHSALISALQQCLFPLRKSFASDFAWKSIHNSLRLLAPIPRVLLRENTVLSPVHLRLLSSPQLLSLLESLLDSELLTEQVIKQVCDQCTQTLHSPASASLLVNMHYLLHRKGAQGLSLKRLNGAQALATRSEYKLRVGELLKLGVAIYPHLAGVAMDRRLLEELSKAASPDLLQHQALLPELLLLVTEGCTEQPVYNYQYFSYSSVESELRHRLAERLATLVLQLQLDKRPVWKYYAQALMATCPPSDLLQDIEQSQDWNAADVAYCLWRYQSHIPALASYLPALLAQPVLSLRALFYISQIAPSASTLPVFQRLISDMKDSQEYFLPLVDILGMDLTKDPLLMEIYREKVRENLHPAAVSGQALYRTIVQLGEIKEYQLITRLIQGLSFWPRCEPSPASQLMEALAETLVSTHSSVPLSLKSVGSLLSKGSGLQLTSRARARLRAVLQGEESTRRGMEEEDLIRLKTANAREMVHLLCRLPHSCTTPLYAQALSFVSPSSFSAAIFRTLASAQVLHLPFLQKFISHLAVEKDAKEVVEMGRPLLEYLAVVGEEAHWPKVRKVLGRAEVVQQMDWAMAVNFAFLCLGEQKALAEVPKAVFTKIYSVIPEGSDETLNPSSIPGLNCYLPFDFQYELEERTLETNNYVGKNTELVFQKRALLNKENAEIITRVRAVKNYLKQPISTLEDSAVTTLHSLRTNTPEFKEFSNDIDAMITEKSEFALELHNLRTNYKDENLGWVLDAAFPRPKIGIMLYLDQDIIKSATGSELLPCFFTKQQKYQLEHFTKWTIIALRFRVWRQLSREKRQELLNHILHKQSS